MCLNIVKSDSKTAAKHKKNTTKREKGAKKESFASSVESGDSLPFVGPK